MTSPMQSVIPGVEITSKVDAGVRIHSQVAVCHCCGATATFPRSSGRPLPSAALFKKMRHRGWQPHKKGKHLCQTCINAQKPPSAIEPNEKENEPMTTQSADLLNKSDITAAPASADLPEGHVDAVYLTELAGLFSSQARMAKEVGVSQATISRSLRSGMCPPTVELAAEALLNRLTAAKPTAPAPVTLLVAHVTPDDLPVVSRVLDGLGIQTQKIEVAA